MRFLAFACLPYGPFDTQSAAIGEASSDCAGVSLAMADFDGEGQADLVVGAPGNDAEYEFGGTACILGSRDFSTADTADGVIELSRIGSGANPVVLADRLGTRIESLNTVDCDGHGADDIAIAFHAYTGTKVARVIAGTTLAGDRPASSFGSGGSDRVDSPPGSYEFDALGAYDRYVDIAIASAGDVDADALDDISLAVIPNYIEPGERP